MISMKLIPFVTFLLFTIPPLKSQQCAENLPDEWDFKKETDFAQYEEVIIECINWLSNTPIESNKLLRNKAIKFINDWVRETPTLLVHPYCRVSNWIFKDIKNDDKRERYGVELFMAYNTGMVKYLIENKESSDLTDVQMAGIKNVLRLYKKNSEIISDSKAVQNFINLKETGELDSWIEKKLTKRDIKLHNCFFIEGCDKNRLPKNYYSKLNI